jgi:uncharacterized protein YecE (DUF72 family)
MVSHYQTPPSFSSSIETDFEFRHPGWHREETFLLLEAHGAVCGVMSGAGLPCVLRATAPFGMSVCVERPHKSLNKRKHRACRLAASRI